MDTSFGEQLDEIIRAGGIQAVFGVPGGQTLPLYGTAHGSGRRQVVMRDERNAACAADAYARVSGRVGICDATVGPGVTNLVSGLAEAYASSVPVIAIIADIPAEQEHLRRRSVASQAAPQRALLEPVSKWVARVERPGMLPSVFDQALRVAVTGRPGPVVVEIPEDVFLGPADQPAGAFGPELFTYPRFRPAPDPDLVAAIVEHLSRAERPLLLAGGGVTASGAASAVSELAERFGLPIATTINGKGAIDERSPLSAGVVGMFGSGPGNAALVAADVVLAVGTKLDQLSTQKWRLPGPDQVLLHVDIDGEEIGRAIPAAVGVVADARSFARALADRLVGQPLAGGWVEGLPPAPSPGTDPADPAIAPEAVVQALDGVLDPGDVLVCDASLASGWASAHYRVKQAGVGMVAPRGLAGLGWSPGAAIGARLAADGSRRVVALAGDGAWGYGLAEVETAARLGLDLTYVVLNNSALAWIKHVEAHMEFESSSAFTTVDFAAVATAMGGRGVVVHELADLADAIQAALAEPGPSLLDVRTTSSSSPIISYKAARTGAYQ